MWPKQISQWHCHYSQLVSFGNDYEGWIKLNGGLIYAKLF